MRVSTPAPIELASDCSTTVARPGSAVGSVRDDQAGGIDYDEVGLAPPSDLPPNQEEEEEEEEEEEGGDEDGEEVVAPSASTRRRGSPSGSSPPLPDASTRSAVLATEDGHRDSPPPPSTPPTPSSGRLLDTDEIEYGRSKQSPTTSSSRERGGAELAITDAVQNFRQLPKSERKRALLELKKELDNQSLLSGLGIEEGVIFDDGASTASSDDDHCSVYSNDGSTAFYTEASTAFYTEASTTAFYTEGVRANDTFDTGDYLSGADCGRNATQCYGNTGQGRSGRRGSSPKGVGSSNRSVIYEYEEDYDTQVCSMTDACVSLFSGDYKVEVNDAITNQRARGDETRHRKGKGSRGSKVSQKSKSKEIFEDDSGDVSDILGPYKKKDNDGNERSDQCALTNDMSWHAEDEQMGEEVLVDHICGGSEVSQNSTRGVTVKERSNSQRGGKKSDEQDMSYGVEVNDAAAQAHRSPDDSGGVSLISGDCNVKDDVEKKQSIQLSQSNEIIWHKVDEEMREEVSVNYIRRGGSEGSQESKTREIHVDEFISDKSLTMGDYKTEADEENKQRNHLAQIETSWQKGMDEMGEDILLDDIISSISKCYQEAKNEGTIGDDNSDFLLIVDDDVEVDEGYEQSIQRAQSNKMYWHTVEEEMGEEVLVDDVICGGSKVTPKSKSGLTFKERLLSKRTFKKSDERAYVTPSPTRALGGGVKGGGESNSKFTLKEGLGKKSDEGDPTNVASAAHDYKLCATRDSAAIYPFVQECDVVLSVNHENIEVQGENEMDCIGLETKYSEQMTAQIVKGANATDNPALNNDALDGIPLSDPVMSNSKASKSRLETLDRSKGKSDYSDPLSFAAADPAFSVSNEVKIGNGVDIVSLKIPSLDQLAALIWYSPGKDPVMDEAKLDGIARGDPGDSDVHASRPNGDSINQNARSGITVKKRMDLLGRNGEKSDDTYFTFDADLSPIFVSANAAPVLEDTSDLVLKAQQDEEFCPAIDSCSLCDGVWDLEGELDEVIELSSYGVVQDDNATTSKSNVAMQDGFDQVDNKIERKTGSPYSEITTFGHLAALFWKNPRQLPDVDEAKLGGIDQGDVVVSDENASRPDVDSISRNSTSGIIAKKGDNVTKQNNVSSPKVSNKSQVTTSNSFIGGKSQKDVGFASSMKAKSSSRMKSTKPPKSASKGDVSGITPKNKKWREYIDPSSGKPYYSNGLITTWDKPLNVEITHPRTPIVSNRRKSASPESAPLTPDASNRRDFTISASTPPSMEEQQLQPQTQGRHPESKENKQNQQLRQQNKFKLFLTKKKAPSISDPSLKETTNAPCSPDRTVSSTDEDSNDNLAANAATADANVDTMKTTGAATKKRGWREYTDPNFGRKYYSDGVTSTWEKPITFTPEKPASAINV